jgi:regulatory protein
MEIINLKTEGKTEPGFVITDLKQGVKNENRVNVFVNGKYSFSLDISQVVDFHLKRGLEISEEQIEEYKRASEFGKLYQRTLEWVLVRPRSEKETYDYLYKKIYEKKLDKDYINRIIDRLKEKKYLNDETFARYYVENRFVKKGISKKRLRMELMKKGVAAGIIDEVLDGRNDEEEIKKMIIKKRARYDDEKLTAYLCRQGFDYQLVKDLVQTCGTDLQNLE